MTNESVIPKSLPLSVQLLFENTKLDLTKTILLLYAYSLHKKVGMKISEIVFYYSLVNFGLIDLFLPVKTNTQVFLTNRLFRYEVRVKHILLHLSQLRFINVYGSLNDKASEIRVKITPCGESFVQALESRYLKTFVDKYEYALKTVEFSPANLQILRGDLCE